MNRRQHDTQPVGVKHHRDIRRVRQRRKHLRMAFPRQAGERQRFLADRRRSDGLHPATLRIAHRAYDGFVCGLTRSRRQLPRRKSLFSAVDERYAHGAHSRVGRRSLGNFRTDAGGIARGDGDTRK